MDPTPSTPHPSPPEASAPLVFDGGAKDALLQLTEQYQDKLLEAANRLAGEGFVTEAHVRKAHQQLLDPNLAQDLQAIITTALMENRAFEWLSYIMVVGLFLLGGVLLCAGAWSADIAARIPTLVGGAVIEAMLLPAIRFAVNARRHNIAIRLTGALLDRSGDPKALTPTLVKMLEDLATGKV